MIYWLIACAVCAVIGGIAGLCVGWRWGRDFIAEDVRAIRSDFHDQALDTSERHGANLAFDYMERELDLG